MLDAYTRKTVHNICVETGVCVVDNDTTLSDIIRRLNIRIEINKEYIVEKALEIAEAKSVFSSSAQANLRYHAERILELEKAKSKITEIFNILQDA